MGLKVCGMSMDHWFKRVNVSIVMAASLHCRTLNNLFMPENMARLSETFSRAHDLMDIDKNVVLGKKKLFPTAASSSSPSSSGKTFG